MSIDQLMLMTAHVFQVALAKDEELALMMTMLGLQLPSATPLPANEDFSLLFDYSDQLQPMLTQQAFDHFYAEWLRVTKRDGSMNEYGQLLFLHGQAREWNAKASRFILKER